jgi:APA family basic amino acid/polyamine antiporter
MSTSDQSPTSAPRRVLSTFDGIVLVVGLVVGAGIFRSPPIVAANVADVWSFFAAWVAGGLVALTGALCYAELASAYPHPGGEYHVLRYTFGQSTGFMLGWARMTVMQTGSIALLAFVFADYAVRLLPGGGASGPAGAVVTGPALAAGAVVLLTLVNMAGLRPGQRVQYALTAAEVGGLVAVIVAGFVIALRGPGADITPPAAQATTSSFNPALALVFVLLTYGGWSEAAYLSAELRDRRRGVRRTLTWAVGIVTALYLLANVAYAAALGLDGVARSSAVAVDVMRAAAGAWGAVAVGVIVMASALSSANASMITGARGSFAVGRAVSPLGALGIWRETAPDDSGAPRRALVVQAIISLILVAFGAATRAGFETMVAYTAPVFWLTLLLMGVALFVLRRREPDRERPFRVPLYPLTPLVFCLASAGMLYSSVAYAGRGALLGVAVMLAGLPLLLIGRSRVAPADQALGSVESTL